jgi:YcxB-like protein
MIQLDYQITLSEYIDGGQAMYKARLMNPWVLWGIFRGLPIVVLLFSILFLWTGIAILTQPISNEITNSLLIWMGANQASQGDEKFYLASGCIGLLVSSIFPVFIRPNVIVRGHGKTYEQTWNKNPLMGAYRTLTATETEFSFKSDSFHFAGEWSTLTRVIESPMVFIFFFFTGECRMISKQSFPSEDLLNQFRDLVKQHVKKYVDLAKDSIWIEKQ